MMFTVDLFDCIGFIVLVAIFGGLGITYVVCIIGYEISRLIVKIQERLWKK